MAKSSVTPIQCSSTNVDAVQEQLPCWVENFPVTYLRLPLSIKKLAKPQLQPLIDRLADFLPGWKADLMTREGRAIQVQFVLAPLLFTKSWPLTYPIELIKPLIKYGGAICGEEGKMQKGSTV
jgi:hypothetical protein